MSSFVQRMLDCSLFDPANHFMGCQGKRIRGSLLQFAFEMAGGSGDVMPEIGDAIESLHAGSLVIDDVQDDSQCRRGQMTMHRSIGVPLAINAGNWMYFRALESLESVSLPSEQRSLMVTAMIRAARQCHEGQAIDLYARVDRVPAMHWEEATLAISTLKTGALVELAMVMGCVAADPSSSLTAVLPHFGRQIGVALQMRNDLDELATIARHQGQGASFESVRDDDLRNARLTWPWVWAYEQNGAEVCHSLVHRVVRSQLERHAAGCELFELSSAHGHKVIGELVREQMRLLGEHVVERRLLASLAEVLRPIEGPILNALPPARGVAISSMGAVQ